MKNILKYSTKNCKIKKYLTSKLTFEKKIVIV